MANNTPKFVRFGGQLCDVIEDYEQGIYDGYNLIIQQIGDPGIKSSHLCALLSQLMTVVHSFDKRHKQLVTEVLKIQWVKREREVMETFHTFLLELVTANPVHQVQILNALVLAFQSACVMSGAEMTGVSQEEVFHLIHTTIRKIFTLIPLSITVISPLLSRNFPFIKKDIKVTEWYLKNLLFMTTYQPRLREKILELAISKALKLDVMLPREKFETANAEEEDIFEMDLPKTDDFSDKFEVIMDTLLQYVYDVCHSEEKLTNEARKLLEELISIFDRVILPVHGCSHVQFILFFICSFKQGFHEIFIDHLWKKVENPSAPVLTRQTAISYIASMLARAKYIPLYTVMTTLKLIASWAQRYIKEREDEGSLLQAHSAAQHGTFYGVCQAIFYVIIFRHKQITDEPKGFEFLQNLHLEHLIISRINPLKFCVSTVVNLFSSIMRQHQVVYCNTIIERNNRQCIPVSGSSALTAQVNPLDSFFPFDPYLLKISRRFIEEIYQEWEGRVPVPEENNNKDSWSEDSGLMGCSLDATLNLKDDNPDHTFCGMSMSPGFSLMSTVEF